MTKAEKTIPKNALSAGERAESIIANIICIMTFIAFAFIAMYSVFQTSVIDPNNYSSEIILYNEDNVLLNLMLFALFFLLFFGMGRYYDFFSKINIHVMEGVVAAVPLILGLIWVLSVRTIPGADSANVYYSATGAVNGDYTEFLSNDQFYNHDFYNNNSYYWFYPFQLGFVFISEIVYRLVGTGSAVPMEILNVFCVSASYLAIAWITRLVFKRKSVEFITIVLLIGCFQPVFFAAFPYGNIIGMCCALWSAFFLIKYMQNGNYFLFIPMVALLTVAVLAKYNNMIYLVAFGIVLIVHAIRKKKWQSIALILALAVSCVGASKLVIWSYELRADTQFKSGVSQVLYLDGGLNESWMAPGWYTKRGLETYLNNNFDSGKANEAALEDIGSRVERFASDLGYTYDFFSKKIVSQWNEPSYESIWVSEVKGHEIELNDFANSVYNDSWGQFFDLYFNLYMQLVFVLFAGGILMLIIKKRVNMFTMLLPLILLGGFWYHLLFEGKSQYLMSYIILLLPYAAYFASEYLDFSRRRFKASAGQNEAQAGSEKASDKDKESKKGAPEVKS